MSKKFPETITVAVVNDGQGNDEFLSVVGSVDEDENTYNGQPCAIYQRVSVGVMRVERSVVANPKAPRRLR